MPTIVTLRMLRPAFGFRHVAISLALLSSVAAHADERQLETLLEREFRHKLVVLRGFYAGPKLRFDANGNPVGQVQAGFWSSDGMLQVTDIALHNAAVRLRGKRVVNVFDRQAWTFRNVITKTTVQIDIELDPALQDAELVNRLREKIFLRAANELDQTIPDYWQWCFPAHPQQTRPGCCACPNPSETQNPAVAPEATTRSRRNGVPPQKPDAHPAPRATTADSPVAPNTVSGSPYVAERERFSPSPRPNQPGVPIRIEPDGTKVYRVGGPVKAAKAIDAPDAQFTDAARAIQLTGRTILSVVVNERGESTGIHIMQPLGAGLDDAAVATVRNWRFAPATLNGEPVAVQISVEVNFRLY